MKTEIRNKKNLMAIGQMQAENEYLKNVLTYGKKSAEDMWQHKDKSLRCLTCMWYCNTRCRRHSPTISGYPAVFENDWCGDHKLDKETIHSMEGKT